MAQYFFELASNDELIQSKEGVDLDDLRDVRVEAISVLPELAKRLEFGGDHHTFIVTVRDATGNPVFRAELLFNCTWLE